MALNKEAFLRYKIIDSCLRDIHNPYPSMDDLISACENKLGKVFNISTLQKDIKAMKEDEVLGFNAPIKFSKSKNGYFYADKSYSINDLPINNDEIAAISQAGELIQAIGDKYLGEDYRGAYIKLMNALKNDSVAQTDIPFVFSQKTKHTYGFDNYYPLLKCIKEKLVISFYYYSFELMDICGETVHPYQLLEFNHDWYLLGYCERIKDLKIFGLERIMPDYDYETDIIFNDTKRKSVAKYNNDMYGVYPIAGEKKQKIKFYVTKVVQYTLEAKPLHQTQKAIDCSHEYISIFSIDVIPTHELLKWFLANCYETKVINDNIRKLVTERGKFAFGEKVKRK